jgi:hypothetical protein
LSDFLIALLESFTSPTPVCCCRQQFQITVGSEFSGGLRARSPAVAESEPFVQFEEYRRGVQLSLAAQPVAPGKNFDRKLIDPPGHHRRRIG